MDVPIHASHHDDHVASDIALRSSTDFSYMTLTLPYLTTTLAFDSDSETDEFLSTHSAAIYTNPTLPPPVPPTATSQSTNHWKPSWKFLPPPAPTPLANRIWDAKKAHGACSKGIEKYRVVDLKGQVN